MSKDFKRCPRCNFRTPSNMIRCGNCGLNFNKFENATNTEAKSAFRMGEKERVLYTKQKPNDVSKTKTFIQSLFGGWFGLHYFKLGQKNKGFFQLIGFLFAIIYIVCVGKFNIRTGYLGFIVLVCGIVWLISFIIWWADTISIIFNKFKYPVSLPYSYQIEKLEDVKLNNDTNIDKGD